MGFLLLISFLAYFIKHESNSIFYIDYIHTYTHIKVCSSLPRCFFVWVTLALTACGSPLYWSPAAAPAAVAVLKDLNSHFVRHRMEHKRVLTYPSPVPMLPSQVAWRFVSRLIDLKCSDLSGRWRFPCCCQHPVHPPPSPVHLLPSLLLGDVAERHDFASLWLWLFDSTDFLSDTTQRQASWNFSCEHVCKLSLKFTLV